MLGMVVATVNSNTPRAVTEAEIATILYRPSLASAKKPPRSPKRLRVPMKFVTMVADFADEMCKSPTRYVTRFIDMPITHILSESSLPKIKPAPNHPPVLDLSGGFPL